MFRRVLCLALPCLLLTLCGSAGQAPRQGKPQGDPLPSWADGPRKKAILEFVRKVTDKDGPDFVAPADRIATFDNDGTLWVEQPMYTQVAFALDRVKALAPEHPDWEDKAPFNAILAGDREAMAKFTKKDLGEILLATHTGMTVEEFRKIARDWLATAKHPRYKRLYTECIYQPMLEVMRYLRANGFKTYIVTGGSQEFVRRFSDQAYGVPVEQVIGSAPGTKYKYNDGRPVLLRLPVLLLLDDEDGKPEDIELFIGKKPLAAFGNSTGDRQMLEWTQSGGGTRLMMLVHHDDDKREYAYGPKSKIGTFSASLMAEAKKQGWHVISMKDDWRQIFPFEAKDDKEQANKLPKELIGKWVVVGGEQDGSTFDFAVDGTMVGSVNLKGREGVINATIRVEGKKLLSTTTNPITGKDETREQTIRRLNGSEMVLEDGRGNLLKMERVK